MSIIEIQNEIVANFELLDNWEDKYAYIIEQGKTLSPMPENHKTEDNLVKGCQSKVWFYAEKKDDKIIFEGDSDALIAKGLVAMLINVLSGQKAEEIATADLFFLEKIGLKEQLSMTRANGLAAMIKQLKTYGVALQ
ncbi:MAG: SufE family protein [Thermonemataceae bacterium]|nr:SufE family protein [Thermonemataceae bacterium]